MLGVALDGVGFGADATVWGEGSLQRLSGLHASGRFKPVAMIGGERAVHEPWRNTYAHLVAAFGWEEFRRDFNELETGALSRRQAARDHRSHVGERRQRARRQFLRAAV